MALEICKQKPHCCSEIKFQSHYACDGALLKRLWYLHGPCSALWENLHNLSLLPSFLDIYKQIVMILDFLSERVTSPPSLLWIHSMQSPRSANVRVCGLFCILGIWPSFTVIKMATVRTFGDQKKHSSYIYVCRWLLTGGTVIPESLVAAVVTV